MHGDDVAAAVRLVLEAPAAKVCGEVFNVSDIVVDRRDILAIVREEYGKHEPAAAGGGSQGIECPGDRPDQGPRLAAGRCCIAAGVHPVGNVSRALSHMATSSLLPVWEKVAEPKGEVG